MRRLSFFSVLLALAGAFALPGAAAASSAFQVATKIDHCQFTGGAHGRGYVELKVRAREVGTSGTNYFLVLSQRQESSGLAFGTAATWPKETSSKFPNNSTSYFHVTDRRYDFTKNDEVSNRLVITVKFKNNAGDVLATRTVKGSAC